MHCFSSMMVLTMFDAAHIPVMKLDARVKGRRHLSPSLCLDRKGLQHGIIQTNAIRLNI
jgi:hypothetical protein